MVVRRRIRIPAALSLAWLFRAVLVGWTAQLLASTVVHGRIYWKEDGDCLQDTSNDVYDGEDYSVTSETLCFFTFAPSQHCVLEPLKENVTIGIVDWSTADAANCKHFTDVISQVDGVAGGNPQLEVVAISSPVDECMYYFVSDAPIGDVDSIDRPSIPVTIITSCAVDTLKTLPKDTEVKITSGKDIYVMFVNGVGLKVYRILFLACFGVLLVLNAVFLAYTLAKRKLSFNVHTFLFLSLILVCILRLIELAVDPLNGYEVFTLLQWRIFYYFSYFFGFCGVALLLSAWVRTAYIARLFAENKCGSKFQIRLICTTVVIFFACSVVFCVTDNFWSNMCMFVLLIVPLLLNCILFLVFGGKILRALKTGPIKPRTRAVRIMTLTMMTICATYLVIIVCLVIQAASSLMVNGVMVNLVNAFLITVVALLLSYYLSISFFVINWSRYSIGGTSENTSSTDKKNSASGKEDSVVGDAPRKKDGDDPGIVTETSVNDISSIELSKMAMDGVTDA